MILRNATILYSGQDPNKLSKGSRIRICVSCDECGRVRWIRNNAYHPLCGSCSQKGKVSKQKGKKLSNEIKQKMSESSKGKHHLKKTKRKISKSRKGKYLGKDNPNYKEKIILICKQCNEEYSVIPSRKNTSKFCSRKCYSKWQSINQCGENNHMYGMGGELNPNFGKSGKKSSTWDHNITDEERLIGRFYPEYKQWRKAVYERDNYTCQICGGINLNAHHLEGYANNKELRISLDNGITLCKKCHKDFHNKYGRRNNTKEQFIEFINGGL